MRRRCWTLLLITGLAITAWSRPAAAAACLSDTDCPANQFCNTENLDFNCRDRKLDNVTCLSGVAGVTPALNNHECITNTCNCTHKNFLNICDTALCQGASCSAAYAATCNDGNACTTDSCSPTLNAGAPLGCSHANVANGTGCSDGNLCTFNDVCTTGVCGGTTIVCTGSACGTSVCNGTSSCTVNAIAAGTACPDDGLPCTTDQCDGVNPTCQHPVSVAGTVCRAAADVCDAAEVCNGAATSCPGDTKKTAGTACTDDGNVCTSDVCDGSSNACQHPAGNAGTVCRPAADVCDVAETCTGSSAACPGNSFVAGGTACSDDGNACTLDQCNGSSAACQHTGTVGLVCRPAAGECDVADTCINVLGLILCNPIDSKVGGGSLCSSDGNACTIDYCNGTANSCQHDATTIFLQTTVGLSCASDGNPCSLDYCNGLDTTCHHDLATGAGTACGGAAVGECDAADVCNGISTTCPDTKVTAGTACADDGNPCSVDVCDGTNNACQHPAAFTSILPPVLLTTLFASCASDANPCSLDYCNGTDTACHHDLPTGAGTACGGAAAGECDVADVCNGLSTACPDTKKTAGTACADDGNPCSVDVCDGTNNACQHPASFTSILPPVVLTTLGSTCASDGNPCSLDVCSGFSTVCTHNLPDPLAVGTPCGSRPSAGECDAPDVCDGVQITCPDVKKITGTACGADANPCSLDICDGLTDACTHGTPNPGAACLDDGSVCTVDVCDLFSTNCTHPGNPLAFGTTCRASAGVCDTAETCDLIGNCPADVKSTSQCRASAGVCDPAETCDGVTNNCPSDAKTPAGTQCRAAACAGPTDATLAASCDGIAAACPPSAAVSCGAYVCSMTACLGACAADSDCATGQVCFPNHECHVNHPPVVTCQSSTLAADGSCQGCAPVETGHSDADAAFGDTVNCVQSQGCNYALGSSTVTVTCTDRHGAVGSCTGVVQVVDQTPPMIACPGAVTVNTDGGACTAAHAKVMLGSPTTSDQCSIASTVNDAAASFTLGGNTVTWTVTDGSGNPASCMQSVTVIDAEKPTITCPGNVVANTDPGTCGTSPALGSPTTGDNCTVASTVSNSPGVFHPGMTSVIWTVTDGSGNTASCTQTVTINDVEKPTITCPAHVTVNADAGSCGTAVVAIGSSTTHDNCAVGSVNNNAPASYALGDTTVTWTVLDASGNSATCTQTVTVLDAEKPTIDCPAAVTVNSDAGHCTTALANVTLGSATAHDNCLGSSTMNDAPAAFALGGNTVTWTVTDGSGNTASCMQSVTVIDAEKPSITCPSNVVANTDPGTCGTSPALGSPTTGDNCTVASTVSNSPGVFHPGMTSVIWTVTDGSGNTASCTQTVTVNDVEKPTITCPANVSATTDPNTCGAHVDAALLVATSHDNCGSSVSAAGVPAGNIFALGVTTITHTATDAAGNLVTCTQKVTIQDAQPPTIACPADLFIATDSNTCGAFVPDTALAASTGDNCSSSTARFGVPAGNVFPLGTTSVMYVATDGAGNHADCVQAIKVSDSQPPTILCPPDVTVATDAGACVATNVALGLPVASDNCSETFANFAPSVFAKGVTTFLWVVTDEAGGSATCSQRVTVEDREPPRITCPGDLVPECVDLGAVASFSPTVQDNCATVTTQCAPPSGSRFPLGVTTDTCVASDSAGNSASCSFHVSVMDTGAPTVTTHDVDIHEDSKDFQTNVVKPLKQCSSRPVLPFDLDDCVTATSDQCLGVNTAAAVENITRIEWWAQIDANDAGNAKKVAAALERAQDAIDARGCQKFAITGARTANLPFEELDDGKDAGFYRIYFTVGDGHGNQTAGSCRVNFIDGPGADAGDHGDHNDHGDHDDHGGPADHGNAATPLSCAVCVGTDCGPCATPVAACKSAQRCEDLETRCKTHGQSCPEYVDQCTDTCRSHDKCVAAQLRCAATGKGCNEVAKVCP